MTSYDDRYYEENSQDEDRLALRWYSRVLRKRLPTNAHVLDFGCGAGHLSLHLSKWATVSSLDSSPVARAKTSARIPSARMLSTIDELDAQSLDAVVSLHVLEHIENPQEVMRSVLERLKPGGLFFFVVPDLAGRGASIKGKRWFAYRDPTHCTFLTSEQWAALCVNVGFLIEVEGSDGLWDSPYLSYLPKLFDRLFFGFPLIVNVVLGRISSRPNRGECAVIVARKPSI